MDEFDSLIPYLLANRFQLEDEQIFRHTNVDDPIDAFAKIIGNDEDDWNVPCWVPVGIPPKALILENIKTYTINGMCHEDISFEVESILELQNESEWEVPPKDASKDYTIMLWHGTTLDGAKGILTKGFEMPSSEKADSLMFGNGIYFADRVSKSAQYCDVKKGGRRKLSPEKGQKGCLLLCDVNVGNMSVVHEPLNGYTSLPQGFDSIKGEGSLIPDPEECAYFQNSVIPLGPTSFKVENLESSLRLNEYVVYDPSRINVRFLLVIVFN